MALVKKAFDRGFIDSHILGYDHFEQDLRQGMEHPDEPWRPDDRDSTLFGDTDEELSRWYCFSEQYREDQERWQRRAEADLARSQRVENPSRVSGETTRVPAAAERNSRSAALLRRGTG